MSEKGFIYPGTIQHELIIQSRKMKKRPRQTFEFSKKSTSAKKAKASSGKGRSAITKAQAAALSGLEHKYFDTSVIAQAASITINGATTLVQPTAPANAKIGAPDQGDGKSQREGRYIHITGFEVQGKYVLTGSETTGTPAPNDTVSLAFIQDKQPNRAQFVADGCYSQPVGSITMNANLLRNPDFIDRFKVWKRETVQLNPPSLASEGAANTFAWNEMAYPFEWHIKFPKPIKVLFDGTTSNINNIVTNSFDIYCIHGGTTALTQAATISYFCRCRFYG